jgi:hypothetical protein
MGDVRVDYNIHSLESNKMKVVIHQPQYFPYPGFFHKLSMADLFIIMDNTQYDKRFTNRNKIISTSDSIWITVPINKKQKFSPNREVEINNSIPWKKNHWNKINHAYKNSKYFNLYEKYLENIYQREWNHLYELNLETLKKTIEWLGLKIKIVQESELKISGNGTEKLVNCCKEVGADTYISGRGLPGKKYLDESLFEQNSINLVYQDYTPLPYEQKLSTSFIPNLSIIDMICNLGPDSFKHITKKHIQIN